MNAHDVTVILTGGLVGILCSAAIFTAPIALWLIGRYRRTVIRLMSKSARIDNAPQAAKDPLPISSATKTRPELTFLNDTFANQGEKKTSLYEKLNFRRWQASAVHALGGLVFAAILTGAQIAALGLSPSIWDYVLVVSYRLWPVVLIVNFIASVSRRTSMVTIGSYFGIWAFLNMIEFTTNPLANWAQAIVLWGQINMLPTLLLVAFLYRRVRAVGPMVFTLLSFGLLGLILLGTYGGSILIDNAIQEANLTRGIVYALIDLGLPAITILVIFYFITFVIMVAAGWLTLQGIKWLYVRRRLSDYSIVLDPILIIFALVFSAELVFVSPVWFITGFAAFAAYKAVTWMGFAVLHRNHSKTKGPKLLLLRVFSLGKRSEQLYRAIAKAWRYVGGIRFITGPDLASSTVEPHNFLDYISGRLAQHFIDNPETLERRLANADTLPQLDGRYRNLDFFCHDDTWKMVLSRLAEDSDVILMDLRKFSRTNAGCVFEINELVNQVPLNRVIFVIDKTTDKAFLRESMEKAWNQMHQDSPNHSNGSAIRLFDYSDSKLGDYDRLLQALAVAVTPA